MSRYIDADKLKDHTTHYVRTQPHFHYGDWDNMCISGKEIDEIVDTCPTADVVEVVRCGQCKYWSKHEGCVPFQHLRKCFRQYGAAMGKDDFCSLGERGEPVYD